jgi:predicted transcriptional regulator
MDDLMKRTVHELSQRERDAAVAAFKRAHDAEPEWNLTSDRAWLEGFAAGRVANGEEVADLRNVVQAACTQGGLAAMARAWAKYFPDHPITVAGLQGIAGVPGKESDRG